MIYSKTHFRKVAQELRDKLELLVSELEDLQGDLENESSEIEPYEGKDDLTPQQEERQEWLDESASNVEQAINEVNEALDSLESLEY